MMEGPGVRNAVIGMLLLFILPVVLFAETGADAWLRYAPLGDASMRRMREAVPTVIVSFGAEAPVQNARAEMIRGIRGMLNRNLRIENRIAGEGAIVLGTLDQLRKSAPQLAPAGSIETDGFWLRTVRSGGARFVVVTGQNDRGVLYGAFALLRKIALGEAVADLDQ
jgi:alpha-glucuronidase